MTDYKIHDDPPVITSDPEAIRAAKQLGYEVTKVSDNGGVSDGK